MATKEKTPTEALAVAKTEDTSLVVSSVEDLALVGGAGAAARALAMNKGFHIEQVVSLREGDSIEGVYAGPGGDIQLKDDSLIPSWKVALTPQVTAILVGTYKLNQFFRGLAIGTSVVVEHKGKVSLGGKSVNQYYCVSFTESPKEGK